MCPQAQVNVILTPIDQTKGQKKQTKSFWDIRKPLFRLTIYNYSLHFKFMFCNLWYIIKSFLQPTTHLLQFDQLSQYTPHPANIHEVIPQIPKAWPYEPHDHHVRCCCPWSQEPAKKGLPLKLILWSMIIRWMIKVLTFLNVMATRWSSPLRTTSATGRRTSTRSPGRPRWPPWPLCFSLTWTWLKTKRQLGPDYCRVGSNSTRNANKDGAKNRSWTSLRNGILI